jgi:hypothetical protein
MLEQQQATQNPPTFGRYGEIPPRKFSPKQKEAYDYIVQEGTKGSCLHTTQRNLVFCSTTKRLAACGTRRADFSCAGSEGMHATS